MINRQQMAGVTLIELMIVVAVIGILGTLAATSYRHSLLRSHRSEAAIALTTLRVEQEKFFIQNRRYARSAELSTSPGLNIASPTANGYYTIALTTTNSDTAYSATATATSSQTDDTDCRTFTVTSTGSQTSTNSAGSASAGCWR